MKRKIGLTNLKFSEGTISGIDFEFVYETSVSYSNHAEQFIINLDQLSNSFGQDEAKYQSTNSKNFFAGLLYSNNLRMIKQAKDFIITSFKSDYQEGLSNIIQSTEDYIESYDYQQNQQLSGNMVINFVVKVEDQFFLSKKISEQFQFQNKWSVFLQSDNQFRFLDEQKDIIDTTIKAYQVKNEVSKLIKCILLTSTGFSIGTFDKSKNYRYSFDMPLYLNLKNLN